MDFVTNLNFWLCILLIIWICGIFYLSSNKGSVSRTFPYFVPILKRILPGADALALETRFLVVRKLCHFFGYGILALLASGIFYGSSLLSPANGWYIYSFAIVLAVASMDEIRQSFYKDRVGSLSDSTPSANVRIAIE